MSESFANRLIIAAPEKAAVKLGGILSSAGIAADAVYHSGEEALHALGGQAALLLTTYQLSDMEGAQLTENIPEGCEAMMIVPGDYAAEEGRALLLRNPLTPDALVQAVHAMRFAMARMDALRKRAEKAERMLAERKVIERAKGRLMDALGVSEKEAHYRIQKKSMDSGKRIVEIAQEILDAEEITPEGEAK